MKRMILAVTFALWAVVAKADTDVPGQIVIWNMGWNATSGLYIKSSTANLPPYNVPGWTIGHDQTVCRIGGIPFIMWWNEAAGVIVPWGVDTTGHLIFPVVALPGFSAPIEPQWKLKGCTDIDGDGSDDLIWIYIS